MGGMVDRSYIIKDMILSLSERIGLEASFKKARRRSDVAFLKLYGDRRRVLSVPPVLEDIFPNESVEIIQGHGIGDSYVLTFAVTLKLEEQIALSQERRKKLVRYNKNIRTYESTDKTIVSTLS